METLTITLAGQKFVIQPLTVGQLQDLHVGVVETASDEPAEGVRQYWTRNIKLISIALSEAHPNMTEDTIRKMRLGTLPAVKQAVEEILIFAGIWVKKESKSGEAPAATE